MEEQVEEQKAQGASEQLSGIQAPQVREQGPHPQEVRRLRNGKASDGETQDGEEEAGDLDEEGVSSRGGDRRGNYKIQTLLHHASYVDFITSIILLQLSEAS